MTILKHYVVWVHFFEYMDMYPNQKVHFYRVHHISKKANRKVSWTLQPFPFLKTGRCMMVPLPSSVTPTGSTYGNWRHRLPSWEHQWEQQMRISVPPWQRPRCTSRRSCRSATAYGDGQQRPRRRQLPSLADGGFQPCKPLPSSWNGWFQCRLWVGKQVMLTLKMASVTPNL